jgi:hypothetical protein
MKVLRMLGGSLLWILAGVTGLLGGLLTVTLLLAPLGIPLLFVARKLFRYSMRFFVPHELRHPAKAAGSSARKALPDVSTPDLKLEKRAARARKKVKRRRKKVRRHLADSLADILGL